MPFNIQEFKARIDRYGGMANNSFFTVNLIRQGAEISAMERDVTFFCHTVSMPGINFTTQMYRPNNIGIAQHMPVGIEAERLDCIVYVDDQKEVLRFFHQWMQSVYNYSDLGGKENPRAGTVDHLPYEINYKTDYTCVLVLRQYAKDGSFYEWIFDGVYPTDIGSIRLSWSDQAAPMDLPVHFSYSSFRTSGTRYGNASDVPFINLDESRTSGIVYNQQPNFLRDIRNVVNRFSNARDRLRSIFPNI